MKNQTRTTTGMMLVVISSPALASCGGSSSAPYTDPPPSLPPPAALVITTTSLPGGIVGDAKAQAASATFRLTLNPASLTLNPATISIAISARQAGPGGGQQLNFTASTRGLKPEEAVQTAGRVSGTARAYPSP